MTTRILFTFFLGFIVLACQPAPATGPVISSTQAFSPGAIPPSTATATPAPTFAPFATPTVSPDLLKEEASRVCESAFSGLFEPGPLTAPFAVMKKITYTDAPAWELSHQLPHMGSLSAAEVRTVFCISETRTQAGSYTDGSAAYQLFWDVRAVAWPEGKVIGRNSFTGSPPPKTRVSASGSGEGSFPFPDLAAWIFHQVDHPDFIHFADAVTTVAISPAGNIAAFGTAFANQIVDRDYQAKIFLFNPSDMQIHSALDGHQGMVTSLAFSPDGKTLASSGFDLFVKFWDVATRRLLGQVSIADTPNSLRFSPDGMKLAVASNLGVAFLDPVSMRVEGSVQEASGEGLAFSPDGSQVYLNSLGSIKVIDPNAGIVTLTFPDRFKLIPTVSVSADGSVVSVTYESPETVEGFTLSPDGAQIITYTTDRSVDPSTGAENVRLATWDAKTGKYMDEIKFAGDQIQTIKFSPDGSRLGVANNDEIWLWDTAGWQIMEKLSGHIGIIPDLVFSPDGTRILSAASDGTIRVWPLEQ